MVGQAKCTVLGAGRGRLSETRERRGGYTDLPPTILVKVILLYHFDSIANFEWDFVGFLRNKIV